MGCCCFWLYVLGAVALTIFVLTKLSPTLKYHIKYVGLCLSYINLTLWCGVFALANPRSAKNTFIANFFSRVLAIQWWFGYSVKVENWHHLMNAKRPCIVVSNHQSLIDALFMLQYSPNGTAPVAKKELLYVPVFGVVCWLYGTVFLDRSKGRVAMQNVGTDMKRTDTSVWIFAEGTRNQFDAVGAFKKGAFHLAVETQLPIVPVVIGNYRNVIDRKNRRFPGGEIRAQAYPMIETEGLTTADVNDLVEKVHKIISDGFDEDYQKHADLYANLTPVKQE
jgi:lysophosphatidate acyltransferase